MTVSARFMVRNGRIGPLCARRGVSDRAARAGKGVCKGFAPGLGASRAPRRWDVGAPVGLIGLARGRECGHCPEKNALRALRALFGAACGCCEPSPGWWLAPAGPCSVERRSSRAGRVGLGAILVSIGDNRFPRDPSRGSVAPPRRNRNALALPGARAVSALPRLSLSLSLSTGRPRWPDGVARVACGAVTIIFLS